MAPTGSTPVEIAEQLLTSVKALYSNRQDVKEQANPLQTLTLEPWSYYNGKLHVEDLIIKLQQAIFGRHEYTSVLAESCQESSALGFIASVGVADAIGDRSLTVTELSEETRMNPVYLNVALQTLIKHGYFEEVGEFGTQIYRNNYNSEILRKDHPESLKDAVEFICDESFKATAYLSEAAKIPEPGQAKHLPAGNIAFDHKENLFLWLNRPENQWRNIRMGNAMRQLQRTLNDYGIEDYSWKGLNSPIVDVGGGIGTLELELLKQSEMEQHEFIIFDLPNTIENAQKFWSTEPIQAWKNVSFQAGNFSLSALEETGLPLGKPTYIIRHVLHNWTDEDVIKILGHVRSAMLSCQSFPKPRLVLCEILLNAQSSRFTRATGMHLLALTNGYTRVLPELLRLTKDAGFELERVCHVRSMDTIVELFPI